MIQKLYSMLGYLGGILGCHQRSDRSFFIHGKQFPVCARCTGVFTGQCIGFVCFRFFNPPNILLILFCAVMFCDWFIQYLKICESSNIRRFITGSLCGYAYITFILRGILYVKHALSGIGELPMIF